MANTTVSETILGQSKPVSFAISLLARRYLHKDKGGEVIETPEQMFRRVANTIAAVEAKYGATDSQIKGIEDQFYQLMAAGFFLPNSPTLMNAGRENGMLSACFVLPVPDSIAGIFDAVKHAAEIQKAGGGTGFCFDQLRPTGDTVRSSGGRTSGPISFMKVFSETTNAIQQGAFRRGANMGMISLEHPDILKFIAAKSKPGAFENFNLSVKVTDGLMKQLSENPDSPHVVTNPRNGKKYVIPHGINVSSYTIADLIPFGTNSRHCYTVGEIWNLVVRSAHASGEPGLVFIDRINRDNPTPLLGQIEATNPCGEQPLLPHESCNLGSINLAKFIVQSQGSVDWDELARVATYAGRFLDNVIDVGYYPIPEITEITLGNRKIGLGLMGFADALVLLNIRYASDEAVRFAEKVSQLLTETAHEASEKLAGVRGVFPNWEGSIWDTKYRRPMRNAACTTIAPTGSISLIAGCSSGIEPVFSLVTKRRALEGEESLEFHPLLERLGQRQGWMNDRIRAALLEGVPPKEISGFPKPLAELLVTAHEVTPEWHVRVQAAFQEHTDNAVSKTVNLPLTATIEEVDKVYRLAFELGSKGITVYRQDSREDRFITPAPKNIQPFMNTLSPRPRPRKTTGSTIKSRTGCGTLFITVNGDENGLCEVFANLGKAGGCPSQSEATCRVVSAALRCGVAPQALVEQLRNIRCLSTIARRSTDKRIDVLSCPDAIGQAIQDSLQENYELAEAVTVNKCPDCGYPLRREQGCGFCDNENCAYIGCG